jgi:N-acetylglucosaminyldiphosphoundecaprenol N-acetyl-beta-D-mannosaminyltransferase
MELLGVKLDAVSTKDLLHELLLRIENRRKTQIVTVNPEFIVEANENPEFKKVLNNADFSLIDGIGVLVGLEYQARGAREKIKDERQKNKTSDLIKFYKTYLDISFFKKSVVIDGHELNRLTGVDLIYQIVQQDWMKSRKIYLLGGADNVSSQAVNRLKRINPDIIFRSSNGQKNIRGFLESQENAVENSRIIADINNFAPDVLLVAYGHPWQDLWIDSFKDELKYTVAIGVGGSFDYIAGRVLRAPGWMRSLGLEWLYRLVMQPKRFKRIVRATWRFANLVVNK